MLHNIALTLTVVPLLVSLVVGLPTVTDSPNKQAEERAAYERRVAPLKAAGIDTNSTEQVISALKDTRIGVRLAAVYLLREKRAKSAVGELRKLLDDPHKVPLLLLEVCSALAELETDSVTWKVPCRRLVDEESDPMIQMRAAGVLARHGDAKGWKLVRTSLLSSQKADLEEAAMVAPFFDGLIPDPSAGGTKIHVLAVCAVAFREANEESQTLLLGVIAKTAQPQDAEAILSLVPFAKSQYAKDSITAVVNQLRHR